LSVKMPAGVDTGDRIRLNAEGEAGRNGGPPGDLYVEVRVKEHEIFEREGEHLSCEVPIRFATATLGGTLVGPRLDGKVSIEAPVKLSAEQREMVKRLDESLRGSGQHAPRQKGFLEGVKGFFSKG